MDEYPLELVTHEAPLLVVSGLGRPEQLSKIPAYPLLNNGPHVSSSVPSLTDEAGERLLEYFRKHDSTNLWRDRADRSPKFVYRIRAVGREYRLPPRKANPPSPGVSSSPAEGSPARVLHSPISPLSPDSPLYPDGAISHIWLRKHQSLLPSVFVAFYSLYTETNDISVQNAEDNHIITSINNTKRHFMTTSSGSLASSSLIGSEELRSSGHRTKFVAVILSERSIMSSAHIDDRLSMIRRNTNLAINTSLFYMQSNSSPVEQEQFVSGLLLTLHPGAVEYYRELSKHSRRKRNKGTVPPPTVPAARALSSQAWNLRYEFKLGAFAEFRQEMDVAGRNYETAYEKLLSEVFETTSSWTERWQEARLLSDTLMLRIIRCNLWVDNYIGAKQRWSYHVARVRDVLDRKGKGTETYGFAAWASRWNKCLAELLQLANLPVFAVNVPPVRSQGLLQEESPAIYFRPEKVGERLTSQEYLHHAGFYYLAAAEWTKVREARVRKINQEDKDFDPYLVPPPKEERNTDHVALQMSLLLAARMEFDVRQQKRMADFISYQLAKVRMTKAPSSPELWVEALKDLRGIASGYRREGWWGLLEDALWKIVECGRRGGDAGSTVIAEFELMCASVFPERKGRVYDLGRCLESVDTSKVKPAIVVRAGDVVNILSVSYSFEFPTIHAGQAAGSQLSITSNAHPSSTPLVFSELKITYEGGLKTVLLRHNSFAPPGPSEAVRIIDLRSSMHELTHTIDGQLVSPTSLSSQSYLMADTDLSIAPGQTKIFELSAIPREAGAAKAVCGTFGIVNESFELDFISTFTEDDSAGSVHPLPSKNFKTTPNGGTGVWWKMGLDNKIVKRPLHGVTESLTILPRPPKMEVIPQGLEHGVYVDEAVNIGLQVLNGEDEDAEVGVDVRILGWPHDMEPEITWLAEDGSGVPSVPSLHPLGHIKPSEKVLRRFRLPSASIPADCVLEIKLRYHLLSDPETLTEKVVSVDMPIITPFNCTFDFSPRVHPDAWPDFFSIDDDLFDRCGTKATKKSQGQGIKQRWFLTTNILGVGEDTLTIERWELPLRNVSGGECKASSVEHKPLGLESSKNVKLAFTLDIIKDSLEDRSPVTIDMPLVLHWRRSPDSPLTTTTLPVPRLFVPLREPRVLCEAFASPELDGMMELAYHVENPTNYFLTFSLLMETSEEFAFSGPKQTTLQLLPISKTVLGYRLYPYARGRWIRPNLKVVDRYFNKTLKTSPGAEGMEVDRLGLMVWVPGEWKLREGDGDAKEEGNVEKGDEGELSS